VSVRETYDGSAPRFGDDESYNLTLLSPSSGGGIGGGRLEAATIWGAYHGLQSFSHLVVFDFDRRAYRVNGAPLFISDRPRFAWRELMVDTARHFLPIAVLRRVVDSMVATKLNTLHVHLVDSQAFPLVLPSAPALSRGAYSNDEKYSLQDLAGLRRCRLRGTEYTPTHIVLN
jgi:hexosaminidase